MKPEQHLELREKLSTQSAIAEHMTGEVARLKGELETANSRLAAYQARVAELSALLHPVTTGELNDILAWVDVRLKPFEECNRAMERGEHLLESIRQAPEKTCDDTAINVLATALREHLDTDRKRRSELATLCTRAEKAEALINSSENPNVIRASELGYALARANERIASLEAALRPFAECVGYVDNRQDWPDDIPLWTRGRDGEPLYTITSGDLRRAAAALAGKGGAE